MSASMWFSLGIVMFISGALGLNSLLVETFKVGTTAIDRDALWFCTGFIIMCIASKGRKE